MANNILDEFEIEKEEIGLGKAEKRNENFFIFIAAVIFGFGYIMVLTNGYYHIKSIEYLQIGRQDLIARLGFLSYLNGFIFYPTSIVIIGLTIWLINKRKRKGILRKLIFSILGLIVPGFLFFGRYLTGLFIGPKEKWILGVALIGISMFILLEKVRKNEKHQH